MYFFFDVAIYYKFVLKYNKKKNNYFWTKSLHFGKLKYIVYNIYIYKMFLNKDFLDEDSEYISMNSNLNDDNDNDVY
jgi:hypothetical protein